MRRRHEMPFVHKSPGWTIAVRKQWPLTRVEVELQFNPQSKPAAGGTDISRKITLQGALSAEQRDRLLQAANACPMQGADR